MEREKDEYRTLRELSAKKKNEKREEEENELRHENETLLNMIDTL